MQKSKYSDFAGICIMVCILLFFTVVHISCSKSDACSGVACQNGGTCSGGTCQCPSGYSGTHCEIAPTAVKFRNKTLTGVSIRILPYGDYTDIPIGGSITFTGKAGDSINTVTLGSYYDSSGNPGAGNLVSWDLKNVFPGSDTTVVDINVSTDIYFLSIINHSSFTINEEFIDSGYLHPKQVVIPPDGKTYKIGYVTYHKQLMNALDPANPSIALKYWLYTVTLPDTVNQSYTYTAN